jgi:hypothetical protein
MTRALYDALEETLGFVQRALDHIESGDSAEAELHNLRAYLINILDLIERDPAIEAASDDLYSVAQELAGEPERGRGCRVFVKLSYASVIASRRPARASKPVI